MTPERWAQIEDLFHRAVEFDPGQRSRILDQACNGDSALRREVEVLLSYERSAGENLLAAVKGSLDAVAFPLVGETISHYRILDGLGGGGMGLVYQAEDIKLGRRVALKFLPEESAKDPVALGRFEREARSASALEHPNICPIYEFGEHEGQPFIVMQLLEGETLRELLSRSRERKSPLELARLLDLALQITDGLDAAHRKGIIHRDVKPANIFITLQGQAKILDFGLAKLSRGEMDDGVRQSESGLIEAHGKEYREVAVAPPDLFLSRTGVAMGTAGYMSPEQARGEKLDARTDLFSFGLVLYEMATGHRAFQGDTGPALHHAILHETPSSIRQTNPTLPHRLEAIVHRALEKDRSSRYQAAADLHADLQALKGQVQTRATVRRWIPAAAVLLVLVFGSGAYWLAKLRSSTTQILPQINFRQLTINSPENPVTSGALSPNGKYLAYVDTQGIHVKDIDSGAAYMVSQPPDLKKDSVNWEIIDLAWFPDNTKFLANAHPASETQNAWSAQTTSIWMFSRLSGTSRMLRGESCAYSVSPDGSLIAFGTKPAGTFGDREIWFMGPNGESPRKLFEADQNGGISGFLWSPDGQRGLSFKSDPSGDALLLRDIHGAPPVAVLTSAEVPDSRGDMSWLPDGRLIYQRAEAGSATTSEQATCNFWAMRIDTHSGKLIEKPKRLTNWTGFCIANANATNDGKQLAFLRSATQFTVNVADVTDAGTRIARMRRLALDESWNMTQDWTNDSKSVVFTSNRTGQFAIYKQSLENDQPELVSTGAGSFRDTPVSPDGKWLFGIQWPKPADSKDPDRLMRIPLTGGSPELVTTILSAGIFCARPPSNLCVLGERTEDRKQLILTSIDPVKGRGRELARFSLDPAVEYSDFDVSPDGTRLAVSGSTEGPIHILSLRGQAEQVIQAKFNNAQEFHWSADGKALYVPDQTTRGTVLLYVDLRGKTHSLWEQRGGGWAWARPSPDGRHLAIESSSTSNNVWMMENF